MFIGDTCKNCGHGSHCGTTAQLAIRDLPGQGGEPYRINACTSCRCELCEGKIDEETNKLAWK